MEPTETSIPRVTITSIWPIPTTAKSGIQSRLIDQLPLMA